LPPLGCTSGTKKSDVARTHSPIDFAARDSRTDSRPRDGDILAAPASLRGRLRTWDQLRTVRRSAHPPHSAPRFHRRAAPAPRACHRSRGLLRGARGKSTSLPRPAIAQGGGTPRTRHERRDRVPHALARARAARSCAGYTCSLAIGSSAICSARIRRSFSTSIADARIGRAHRTIPLAGLMIGATHDPRGPPPVSRHRLLDNRFRIESPRLRSAWTHFSSTDRDGGDWPVHEVEFRPASRYV
jgi:hypothetical protein